MEHIIVQTEFETIKRFELNKKDVWLVKKWFDNEFRYGMGETKKQAEKNAENNILYAIKGIPNFINELGSYHKYNNRLEINSIPGAVNFIWQMIPISWQSKYLFRIIKDQNSERTFVEIAFVLSDFSHLEPMRYWSDNSKGFHEQVKDCIYQFYIDREKEIKQKLQHKKLAEWQRVWYSKLAPRKM